MKNSELYEKFGPGWQRNLKMNPFGNFEVTFVVLIFCVLPSTVSTFIPHWNFFASIVYEIFLPNQSDWKFKPGEVRHNWDSMQNQMWHHIMDPLKQNNFPRNFFVWSCSLKFFESPTPVIENSVVRICLSGSLVTLSQIVHRVHDNDIGQRSFE